MAADQPIPSCSFPGCKQHPYRNGYCLSHNKIYGSLEVKKEKYVIPKRSKKMQKNMELLRKLYPAFLALPGNGSCKLNMKGCTKKATVVHHKKGRIGDLLFDQRFWMPSCVSCNGAVESNDAEAREKGLKISKFTKDETENT